ncbi:hypothetical protein [Vibrio fluvialis]|uniref:hypothetical protein n=1 Tax=Vibrio fluvialis TaxID=676 RepID=UPI0023A94F73|nr:hypothetical protein [Vibrio fluvialis]MDE5179188.1 hypothetical protein [Vibrio fluvialis]
MTVNNIHLSLPNISTTLVFSLVCLLLVIICFPLSVEINISPETLLGYSFSVLGGAFGSKCGCSIIRGGIKHLIVFFVLVELFAFAGLAIGLLIY